MCAMPVMPEAGGGGWAIKVAEQTPAIASDKSQRNFVVILKKTSKARWGRTRQQKKAAADYAYSLR